MKIHWYIFPAPVDFEQQFTDVLGPSSLRHPAITPSPSWITREAQDSGCEEGDCRFVCQGGRWKVYGGRYAHSFTISCVGFNGQSEERTGTCWCHNKIHGLICIPANLALSFARRGIRTGLLDTDIFGPSIPTLLNLSGEPRLDESEPTPNPLT